MFTLVNEWENPKRKELQKISELGYTSLDKLQFPFPCARRILDVSFANQRKKYWPQFLAYAPLWFCVVRRTHKSLLQSQAVERGHLGGKRLHLNPKLKLGATSLGIGFVGVRDRSTAYPGSDTLHSRLWWFTFYLPRRTSTG